MSQKRVVVIGAGYGGLSTAILLAQKGYKVTILEKNTQPGGRARVINELGFSFDMGPSWYLMPDVFEYFFKLAGTRTQEYYDLIELNPSYKVLFGDGTAATLVPDFKENEALFESIQPGAGAQLRNYLNQVQKVYEYTVPGFLLEDYTSFSRFLTWGFIKRIPEFHAFSTFHDVISRQFRHPKLRQILEFMAVFLGGSPYKLPGAYTLIHWADFGLHVRYPQGGFVKVSQALEQIALKSGVDIRYNEEVVRIDHYDGVARAVETMNATYAADIFVANADMHHVQTSLLTKADTYYRSFWKSAAIAPSAFCMFLGTDKKISGLEHHTLCFNDSWKEHFDAIAQGVVPTKPQYYVSTPSKTDPSVAPQGKENLFVLVPIPSHLEDTDEIREQLTSYVLADLGKRLGIDLTAHIVVRQSYSVNNFVSDYHAFGGNAFGLAHTLSHSLMFRPRNQDPIVRNLYYTGQYTNPGTGTPLALLSGVVTSQLIDKRYG